MTTHKSCHYHCCKKMISWQTKEWNNTRWSDHPQLSLQFDSSSYAFLVNGSKIPPFTNSVLNLNDSAWSVAQQYITTLETTHRKETNTKGSNGHHAFIIFMVRAGKETSHYWSANSLRSHDAWYFHQQARCDIVLGFLKWSKFSKILKYGRKTHSSLSLPKFRLQLFGALTTHIAVCKLSTKTL